MSQDNRLMAPRHGRVLVDTLGERDIAKLVAEATERLDPLMAEDQAFERHFGRFRRPDAAPRYPVDRWAREHIRWSEHEPGIIEAARFIRCFPDPADHAVVGEIARFCAERIEGEFATDKTLNVFRLRLLRRLESVGFC